MKWISYHTWASCLMAVLGIGSLLVTSYTTAADCQGGATCAAANDCNDCADDCGCGGGGYLFDAELLIFKYNRADGTRIGDNNGAGLGRGEHVNGDYNWAPRLTFGYITDDGLGIRARWFEYTHREAANEGGPSALNVDTYSLDVEVFERIYLNDLWFFEVSGGGRYNEFDEVMTDGDGGAPEQRFNSFSGFGGIVGLEANRMVRNGSIYGRFRQGILTGDHWQLNSDANAGLPVARQEQILPESIVGYTELSMGYQVCRELANGSLLTLRMGYEWQLWSNYSSSFAGPIDPVPGAASGESIFSGPSDVGFNGLTFSAGVQY